MSARDDLEAVLWRFRAGRVDIHTVLAAVDAYALAEHGITAALAAADAYGTAGYGITAARRRTLDSALTQHAADKRARKCRS